MTTKKTNMEGMSVLDDKEINKMITKAKRLWGGKKREITYTDKIGKEEAEIFRGDAHLAGLVVERDRLEDMIVTYIDEVLAEQRGISTPAPGEAIIKD